MAHKIYISRHCWRDICTLPSRDCRINRKYVEPSTLELCVYFYGRSNRCCDILPQTPPVMNNTAHDTLRMNAVVLQHELGIRKTDYG